MPDQYDKDGSGFISQAEFSEALQKNKKHVRAGEKPTHADLQAASGPSILDMTESAFGELDRDGDGSVSAGACTCACFLAHPISDVRTLASVCPPSSTSGARCMWRLAQVSIQELIKLMFPYAQGSEMDTMLEWVKPPPVPEPEPKPTLSKDAVDAIKALFKLHDKDKSKSISQKEFLAAFGDGRLGVSNDELKGMFKDFDIDEDKGLTQEEFLSLMESTGAYDEM